MIDYTTNSIEFKVGEYSLMFPTNVHFETYNVPENYYGVIFWNNKDKYEVLECKLGTRILINTKDIGVKDMPFNFGTAEFLPNYVKVKSIK